MSTPFLTDAQMHARVTDYVVRHRVDYAEALHSVAAHAYAMSELQSASFAESSAPGDAQIDARARAYAAEHHVGYADALAHVVSFSETSHLPTAAQQQAGLNDAQIDTHARAYVSRHRVSYAEALRQVVTFAELGAPAASQVTSFAAPAARLPSASATAPAAPVQQPSSPMSDAELDAAARKHAALHGMSYARALAAVIAERDDAVNTGGAAASDPLHSALPDGVSAADRQLDRAAQAYVRAMGVSYSEALSQVLLQAETSFAEGGAATAGDAVSALQGQYIEIFRAGTHTDSAGHKSVFTAQDVKAIATSYDASRGPAPLTLGHPDTNGPGYGRVKSLQATEDGRLLMLADQIDPAFADSVKAGRYRKRSASFYPPYAPSNPVKGNWYLRHVGWLGAQPPAVAGLADVKFSTAAQDGALCFGNAV